MLFKNKVGALTPLDFHALRHLNEMGMQHVTLELTRSDDSAKEIEDMLSINKLVPIAVRLPAIFKLGYQKIDLAALGQLFDRLTAACPGQKLSIILETTTVALGDIFDYFETKPGDFKALHDFKEVSVSHIIELCHDIKKLAEPRGLNVLIENAPMGGKHFFELGQERIYPVLRTPRHLIKIAKETGISICFHTGNARISSNVLQYMKRSRSLFAAATEEEVLSSPPDWLEFFKEISPYVKQIHLSDSLSWGDTSHSNNIPFRQEHVHELLRFADLLKDPMIPVILHLRQEGIEKIDESYFNQMIRTLKGLKIG
jgi:hypothetical protein